MRAHHSRGFAREAARFRLAARRASSTVAAFPGGLAASYFGSLAGAALLSLCREAPPRTSEWTPGPATPLPSLASIAPLSCESEAVALSGSRVAPNSPQIASMRLTGTAAGRRQALGQPCGQLLPLLG